LSYKKLRLTRRLAQLLVPNLINSQSLFEQRVLCWL